MGQSRLWTGWHALAISYACATLPLRRLGLPAQGHSIAGRRRRVMATIWEQRYARGTHHVSSSVIRELLKLTEQPDFISFAGGLPAPEVIPRQRADAAADTE